MGYYTKFDLAIVGDDDLLYDKAFMRYFEDVTSYTICYLDDIKWYSYNENMKEISKKYPDKVFRLRGLGEECGDVWQSFYKNGLSYVWKLSEDDYPKFDESKLK